jgi:uncharacterized SAM-binding protein YcdF (DUF218 family)
MTRRPPARALGSFALRAALLGAVLYLTTLAAVAAVQVFWPDDRPPPARADAIVCLGAGAYRRDGRLIPDTASHRRALTCAELYAQGAAPRVIFTGGLSAPGSAAAAMAESAGLPETDVIIEPASLSTIQNAAFSLAMLPPETGHVIIVSDAFHLPRAWLIFRALGMPEVALYAADPLTEAQAETAVGNRPLRWWVVREAAAIWFNAARAAAYVVGGWAGIDAETRIGWFD